MADTLTITDNRTGKKYELPIQDGTIRAMDLRQIKTGTDDFGLMTYDPAFMNTANCRSAHHLHRRRQGHPALPRLSDRAARRGKRLPRNRLPDPVRRAADRGAAAGVDAGNHAPHDAPREHQEADGGLPVRRAPDGDLPQHRRRDVRLLSRRQEHLRQVVAAAADAPADRQGAEHRRLGLPPQHRPALRLSRQRPELHRQLPEHAVQDDRAEVPAEPGADARARRAVHPARRPRAELQHHDDADDRQLACRSVLGDGRRGGGALRPAARRRQRGRAPDAERDRLGQPRCPSSSRR